MTSLLKLPEDTALCGSQDRRQVDQTCSESAAAMDNPDISFNQGNLIHPQSIFILETMQEVIIRLVIFHQCS